MLAARIDGADAKSLRDTADQLKDKLGSGVVVLGAVDGDKVVLVAGVTQGSHRPLKAGDLIRPVAELGGGRGGGRPDFAQAGGTKPDQIDAALALVPGLVEAARNPWILSNPARRRKLVTPPIFSITIGRTRDLP